MSRSNGGADRDAAQGSPAEPREVLDIDEAAELLGVSVKTFHKVLHTEDIPGRKVGREWKFSRRALIDWVGSGHSRRFVRGKDGRPGLRGAAEDLLERDVERPAEKPADKPRSRRTAGWQIELD